MHDGGLQAGFDYISKSRPTCPPSAGAGAWFESAATLARSTAPSLPVASCASAIGMASVKMIIRDEHTWLGLVSFFACSSPRPRFRNACAASACDEGMRGGKWPFGGPGESVKHACAITNSLRRSTTLWKTLLLRHRALTHGRHVPQADAHHAHDPLPGPGDAGRSAFAWTLHHSQPGCVCATGAIARVCLEQPSDAHPQGIFKDDAFANSS